MSRYHSIVFAHGLNKLNGLSGYYQIISVNIPTHESPDPYHLSMIVNILMTFVDILIDISLGKDDRW